MRCLGSPILLALASLATTQAHAQDVARANRAMELNATAGSACIVGTPRALSATNSTFQADGGSGGQITLTRLVDPDTALPRSARVDLAIPATCNASHRVIASSGAGGLRRAGGGGVQSGGFAEFLAYSVQVAWAGAQRGATQRLWKPDHTGERCGQWRCVLASDDARWRHSADRRPIRRHHRHPVAACRITPRHKGSFA